MAPNLKPMRFAHAEGHTDVCFTDDGKYIVTGGNDGEVRIWAGIEDDDNHTICVAEEMVAAVACKGARLFVGTSDNLVQAYTFPGYQRDGVITRFTAPVTDISISRSGKLLVSGSCDMEIHISNLITSEPDIILLGHLAPIIGVELDPDEQFLVTSCCDGKVRLWDILLRECVKSWDCVPKSNDFFSAPVLVRASWQSVGKRYLAVPHDKEICLYDHSSWSRVSSLTSQNGIEPFSLTAFSPCGSYLIGVSKNVICLWDVNHSSELTSFTHERRLKICAVVWNPIKEGEIAYCDITGQLGTIESVLEGTVKSNPPESFRLDAAKSDNTKVGHINDLNALKDLEGITFDDDDDDNENAISLEKIKNEVSLNFDPDEKSIDGHDDEDVRSVTSVNTRLGLKLNIQSVFQPSSSPDSLQHRFMVWNAVGIIRCVNNDEENSIDIRFHDSNIHHALHLNNVQGHTMASLSEQAVVLACPSVDDSLSKIMCLLLNAWDGTKEWTCSLPEGESAVAVAVGSSWLAVATDCNYLRLICTAGTQRQVIALPGTLLCLTGSKESLLLVFHGGVGLPDEQNLWYQLITVPADGPLRSSPVQPLPLSPGASLKWAGFSDEGSPCTVDSNDVLRLLPPRSNMWLPVCNTKDHAKGKSDHFFVVGVSEFYQNVRAVLCRGAYYPPTAPLPIVSELPLQLPLCEMDSERSKLEEALWRSQLMFSTMKSIIDSSSDENDLILAEKYRTEAEKNIKESLIKLFALSSRGGLEMRAVELCHLMPTSQVAELAAKYAVKSGKALLAERVSLIVSRKRDKEESRLFSIRARSPDLFASQTQSIIDYDINRKNCLEGDDASYTDKENSNEGESLLLAAKRKRAALEAEAIEIKPTVLSQSQKKLNPFKKTARETSEARGLDLLSSPYNQTEIIKKNSSGFGKDLASVQKVSKPQPKQMTLFGKTLQPNATDGKKRSESKKRPQPFTTWFVDIKSELEEEFPNLDASELTKIGMKRYKEYKEKCQTEVADMNDQFEAKETTEPNAKKTKVDDDIEDAISEQEEAVRLLASAEDKMDTEQETSSVSNVENNKDKLTGISKLKAFGFRKKS